MRKRLFGSAILLKLSLLTNEITWYPLGVSWRKGCHEAASDAFVQELKYVSMQKLPSLKLGHDT